MTRMNFSDLLRAGSEGRLIPGNIDLSNRQKLHNQDNFDTAENADAWARFVSFLSGIGTN